MAAGDVAEALGIAPNTLTFHFDRLRQAGLIGVKREGRSQIYTAQYETMNGLISFLRQNCCAGVPRSSARQKAAPARSRKNVLA
jgi:ArsR family transcriptional regulator, arsenate/arsenite/antimonite-responsive transcriptional repressor